MLTNFIRKFRLSRAFKKLAREIVQLKRELLLELLEKTPTEGSLQTPLNHQPSPCLNVRKVRSIFRNNCHYQSSDLKKYPGPSLTRWSGVSYVRV